MIESSVHVHTTFCDGMHSVEQLTKAAVDKGLKCIGFSGHSYTKHDDFGISPKDFSVYINEIERVKSLYQGKIDVLRGVELDAFSDDYVKPYALDYVIGSSHAVKGEDGVIYIIDGNVKNFEHNVKTAFNGDYVKMCKEYYKQLADFICRVKPDIVGHFDLVTKYNEKFNYFDTESKEYRNSALTALELVLETEAVVEVNTGAIIRGHRTLPYPADFLLKRILERKGKVIITTDAHSDTALTAYADDAKELLKSIGFKTVVELCKDGFYEKAI